MDPNNSVIKRLWCSIFSSLGVNLSRMLSMLGLLIYFLLIFPPKMHGHLCKLVVSLKDNLHEMSKPIYGKRE